MPRHLTDEELRELRIACVHEAGHAAACLEFGIPLDHVRAGVRRRWFGAPRREGGTYTLPFGEEYRITYDQDVLTTLAGPEAQARVEHVMFGGSLADARRRVWRDNSRGDHADLAEVRAAIGQCTFSLRRAERAAGDLVGDLWPRIEGIAAGLAEHGRLNAAQARRAAGPGVAA